MAGRTVQQPESERIATALLISSFEYDHIYFDHLFSRTNWKLFTARTVVEAFEILSKHLVPVIVVDESIPDAEGWKGILEKVQQLLYTPKLIVTSPFTTEEIWADVFQLGGYDLLGRPLEQQEVLHSISMAWLAWQYESQRKERPLKKPPYIAGRHFRSSIIKSHDVTWE